MEYIFGAFGKFSEAQHEARRVPADLEEGETSGICEWRIPMEGVVGDQDRISFSCNVESQAPHKGLAIRVWRGMSRRGSCPRFKEKKRKPVAIRGRTTFGSRNENEGMGCLTVDISTFSGCGNLGWKREQEDFEKEKAWK